MKKIGLGLSGGGYRASIYHLGTFRKLKEMGILDKIDVISSISGGSITSGLYGLYGDNFETFDSKLRSGVKSNVVTGLLKSANFILILTALILITAFSLYLLFTDWAWVSTIIFITTLFIFWKFQFLLFPVSHVIESLYNRYFFHGKTISDLRQSPMLAINSTNLETGRQFTFSQKFMGDSTYSYRKNGKKRISFKSEYFPVSRAVAASACVPFAFTPISIAKKYFQNPNDYGLINPKLVDGGIYDNQGIHKLTQDNSEFGCETIIVSDAGTGDEKGGNYRNTFSLMTRTGDIFLQRIKNIQMMKDVYENYQFEKREIAYQSLGWQVDRCLSGFMENLKKEIILESVYKAHGITKEEYDNKDKDFEIIEEKVKTSIGYEKILSECPSEEELKIARSVSTNLTALSDKQINALIKQASCMTEIQVKLYCPSICKLEH